MRYSPPVPSDVADHYTTLGLDRACTAAQIRTAYRLLAKRHHPDLNPGSPEAVVRAQALNAAYQTLSDAARRRSYDRTLAAGEESPHPNASRIRRDVTRDADLQIVEFLCGTTLDIVVKDPANPDGVETYSLVIPADTAPGTRFRLPRSAPFEGGFVQVRVRPRPGFRFKVRGSDLRCDLRITAARARQGGTETIPGPTGAPLRISLPPGIARDEIVRVPGAGLPRPHGGRGDLLVRVTYRPEVRITRGAARRS